MEKLSGAADLDAAVAIAKDAGFDVSADDWHKYQASQDSVTSEDLAAISGGKGTARYNYTPAQIEAIRLSGL